MVVASVVMVVIVWQPATTCVLCLRLPSTEVLSSLSSQWDVLVHSCVAVLLIMILLLLVLLIVMLLLVLLIVMLLLVLIVMLLLVLLIVMLRWWVVVDVAVVCSVHRHWLVGHVASPVGRCVCVYT